jgi:N-acyl-phosphatidylethanolamine-hydrolysing phospholipase D
MKSAVALAALVLGSACFPSRLLGRNTVAFFSTPRAVPNKIERPYRPDVGLSVLWVGHATALVQMDDRMILTDPLFSTTVAQLHKRVVEPGLEPKNVPRLDAVIISHMHPDHLSYGSLDMIEPKVGCLIVPKGGLVYVPNYSFRAAELGRWASWEDRGLRITAVPVRHSGFRYGVDSAWMTSYSGYVIEYRGMRVYFGGDTAYQAEFFRETGRRFPGIDVALLPIAPGRPESFMEDKHIGTEQALTTMIDLGRRK